MFLITNEWTLCDGWGMIKIETSACWWVHLWRHSYQKWKDALLKRVGGCVPTRPANFSLRKKITIALHNDDWVFVHGIFSHSDTIGTCDQCFAFTMQAGLNFSIKSSNGVVCGLSIGFRMCQKVWDSILDAILLKNGVWNFFAKNFPRPTCVHTYLDDSFIRHRHCCCCCCLALPPRLTVSTLFIFNHHSLLGEWVAHEPAFAVELALKWLAAAVNSQGGRKAIK